jgi:arginine exporter protein ArgO
VCSASGASSPTTRRCWRGPAGSARPTSSGSRSGRCGAPGTRPPCAASVGRRGGVLATVLALTWLNPHVYLDTVLLVGSLANQQGADGRWWFVVGAIAASAVWFAGLGYGARLLAPLFARPVTWRVLDVVVALVMVAVAVPLVLG